MKSTEAEKDEANRPEGDARRLIEEEAVND